MGSVTFPHEFWRYDKFTGLNHAFISVENGQDALCTFRKDELSEERSGVRKCTSCLKQIEILKQKPDWHSELED